jgi:Recombination endonuclease VII
MSRTSKNPEKAAYDKSRYELVAKAKRESAKRWYEENTQQAQTYRRNWTYKKKYGISIEDFDRMEAQQGKCCALCGGPPNGKGRLHVDHCHATGKVRALLCYKCNTAIGMLNEDPTLVAKLERYLNEHNGVPSERLASTE